MSMRKWRGPWLGKMPSVETISVPLTARCSSTLLPSLSYPHGEGGENGWVVSQRFPAWEMKQKQLHCGQSLRFEWPAKWEQVEALQNISQACSLSPTSVNCIFTASMCVGFLSSIFVFCFFVPIIDVLRGWDGRGLSEWFGTESYLQCSVSRIAMLTEYTLPIAGGITTSERLERKCL